MIYMWFTDINYYKLTVEISLHFCSALLKFLITVVLYNYESVKFKTVS